MRVLLEAHHPAHIHFWKYPVRELIARGHEVLMIGRDRDVMRRLLEVYDWIPSEIPKRKTGKNKFPLVEMLERQWAVAKAIRRFRPDVVASLMGSYTQTAKLFGVRNVIFTDSEFQHFNHRIAHPFADEVHTPECLKIDFGKKHRRYRGFHELAYLNERKHSFSDSVVPPTLSVEPGQYVVLRLNAWNTFHDIGNAGLSADGLRQAIESIESKFRVLIQPEGGFLPPDLEHYRLSIGPSTYHDVLSNARFVVTEGFTTASEALALGVPAIVINALSCDTLDYQHRNYGVVQHFQASAPAVDAIKGMVDQPLDVDDCRQVGRRYRSDHCDMVEYIIRQLLGGVNKDDCASFSR